ncbi:MAG: hypothetical protein ABJK64_00955 [Paraglaciecola sp.]|uniref:hypothetical protein n=1 Tax=Paraglaciecola sp. TaxID=1920173 RepID=UPI0032975324
MSGIIKELEISPRAIFQLLISTLMIIIVLMGFAPSLYSALSGEFNTKLLIHTHALLFLSWMFFYTLQAVLPAIGKLDLHIKLGKFGLPLALILTINGLFVTFVIFSKFVLRGDVEVARFFLIQPLTDMVVFPLLVIAAICFRKKPETHKRLMLLATLMLTIAAIVRIHYLTIPGIKFVIWTLPVLLSMAYDYYKKRIIHQVYIFGLILFVLIYARTRILNDTVAWTYFTDLMIALVT